MKKSGTILKHVKRYIIQLFVCSNFLYVVSSDAAEFTGKTFTSSNRLLTTLISDQNYLWAGTCGEGLLKIDKSTGETVLYTMADIGCSACCIRSLAFDKEGKLLVGTDKAGIVRYDGLKWTSLSGLPDNNIRAMTIDNNGKVWAWLQNAGVGSFDGISWQTYVNRFSGILTSTIEGDIWLMSLPADGASNCNDGWIHEYVNSGLQTSISLSPVCNELTYPQFLCVDQKKNCWIGTHDQLIRIDATSVNRYSFPAGKSLTAITVNAGKLLFSLTDYSGSCDIYVYDLINSANEPVEQKLFSFDSRYITAACKDPVSGGFWCATYEGKIITIDARNNHTVFTTGNSVLPSNSISSLTIDKSNKLWIGTGNGIAQFDKTNWTIWKSQADSLPGLDVSSLAIDPSGTIWAGFRQHLVSSAISSGISNYYDDRWHIVKRDYISVKKLTFDNTGEQWVVSEDCVYRNYQQQPERVFQSMYSSDKNIALGTTVNTLAFDKNNTPWIGTGLGLKCYVNNTWIDDTTINKYLPQSANLQNKGAVNTIFFTNNTVWIGTSHGLYKFTNGTYERFDTTGSVLPDLTVQCIYAENSDNVWIGTKKGLVYITGNSHATYTSENTSLYDNDITACVKASTGELWVGTRLGGLTVIPKNGSVSPTSLKTGYTISKQSVNVSMRKNAGHISVILNPSISGRVELSIISLDGKLIRHFSESSAGDHPVTFTLEYIDKKGSAIAQNIYLGIFSLNGHIFDRRIIYH